MSFPKAAGNAVKRASDNLVRAAQKAAFGKAEDDDVVVKTKFVGGIAQVGTIVKNCSREKLSYGEAAVLQCPYAVLQTGQNYLEICELLDDSL